MRKTHFLQKPFSARELADTASVAMGETPLSGVIDPAADRAVFRPAAPTAAHALHGGRVKFCLLTALAGLAVRATAFDRHRWSTPVTYAVTGPCRLLVDGVRVAAARPRRPPPRSPSSPSPRTRRARSRRHFHLPLPSPRRRNTLRLSSGTSPGR
ncbi:MAG: hypothetical protein U1F87_15505 [Kiritimatiellia bacterium]